ncbi:MAG: M24 family metallopeptidase [Patescibacteria group bacterium]
MALEILEDLRLVKSPRELAKIRAAADINDRVHSNVLKNIRMGMRECDVVELIKKLLEREGAKALAFPPLVASGTHAAAIHHGVRTLRADRTMIEVPCQKRLRRGEMVVLDFGAVVDGYNSDMTRTVFLGKPDAKQTKIYNLVLAAQQAALAMVREGVTGGQVDRAARQIIVNAGYRAAFAHGTGHGVGLQIHERPNLKKGVREKLVAGEVITIEPGIYLRGWGGVRIEDLVLVTKSGYELLSKSPKNLGKAII